MKIELSKMERVPIFSSHLVVELTAAPALLTDPRPSVSRRIKLTVNFTIRGTLDGQ
jgi:hypothetical protein